MLIDPLIVYLIVFLTYLTIAITTNPKDFLVGPRHYFSKIGENGQEIDNEFELIKPENIKISDYLINNYSNGFGEKLSTAPIINQYEILNVYPLVFIIILVIITIYCLIYFGIIVRLFQMTN